MEFSVRSCAVCSHDLISLHLQPPGYSPAGGRGPGGRLDAYYPRRCVPVTQKGSVDSRGGLRLLAEDQKGKDQ